MQCALFILAALALVFVVSWAVIGLLMIADFIYQGYREFKRGRK